MAMEVAEDPREGAEVYHGSQTCKAKAMGLLELLGLPTGLFPLFELEEFGYTSETGYFWLKLKRKLEHHFKESGVMMSCALEITAYVEEHKIKELTGVKCKEILPLEKMGLSKCFLTFDDLKEYENVKETSYVWQKQKKKVEHRLETIGNKISYAPKITGSVEKRITKKLTGVKSKESLPWVTICEIYIGNPSSEEIFFKNSAGIWKNFPVSAFEVEEEI